MGDNLKNGLATIPEYLYYRFQKQPDKEAIIFAHTDGTRTVVTFRQLYENANALAKSFLKLGVKESEFIAISLQSCPEWLYATFGAILAGARPISLAFTYTDGSDVIGMMKKLETCSAFILDPRSDENNWNVFQKLISCFDMKGHVQSKSMPYLKFLICRERPKKNDDMLTIEDMISWENKDVKLPQVDPDDIATLFQTSGSTGLPKACAHTHRSVIASAVSFADLMPACENDIMFNDRPFTWIGGFPFTVITGDTRVTRYGYDETPEDLVGFLFDVIRRETCTNVMALSPLLNSFLDRQVSFMK